jgi:hypothetical protein
VKYTAAGMLLSAVMDVVGKNMGLAGGNPLASRTLTAEQLRRVGAGTMGIPAQVRMGIPASVSMGYTAPARGGSADGWGNRSW